MNRQLVKVLAVAVLGAGLAFASAAASVAAANPNCKYLKASEVALAIGTKVKKGPSGPSGAQVCAFVPKHSQLPAAVNVWVQSDSAASIGFSTAKTAFKANIESTRSLGRKSFYVGGGLNTAYVLKGNTLVYVQYVNLGGDPAVIKTAVVKLTKLVLHRV